MLNRFQRPVQSLNTESNATFETINNSNCTIIPQEYLVCLVLRFS